MYAMFWSIMYSLLAGGQAASLKFPDSYWNSLLCLIIFKFVDMFDMFEICVEFDCQQNHYSNSWIMAPELLKIYQLSVSRLFINIFV